MNAWIAFSVLAVVSLIVGVLAAGIYNRLVKLKTACENGFAQIEVQLKRRYDLIPNLVQCVKSTLAHERETLERVVAARNQAVAGLQRATQEPENAAAMQNWMGAEGALSGAMGRLSVVIESYPELKASAAVADLTEQLTTTENRIAYARQSYNDWVTGFNTYRQAFPSCLVAVRFGFSRDRSLLEFADAEKFEAAPSVALA